MHWHKLGLIFNSPQQPPWMISHASNPVVEPIGGSRCRVYFNCRDEQNRGSVASFELDLNAPEQTENLSKKPILGPGLEGTYDDSGISMGCLTRLDDGTRYLYYLGWNLAVTVPWRNSIGLAVAKPGSDSFEKIGLAPIMDRDMVDPFTLSYPWVLRLSANDWRMWYGSNLNSGKIEKNMGHVIKCARSQDGIHWQRTGAVVIGIKPDEIGLSRPCVLFDGKKFQMWFSRKADTYRIGYAESIDGIEWTRMDEKAGIDHSESGWDSQSISYPCVFDCQGKRYMLYNGNNYGRTGIGLAVLEAGTNL